MGVGFGASSLIRYVVSHRLQRAETCRSFDENEPTGPTDGGHSPALRWSPGSATYGGRGRSRYDPPGRSVPARSAN